jgi:anti-anti-sigma factor
LSPEFHVDVTTQPEHVLVALTGELDAATVGRFRAAMISAGEACRDVVLDLGSLTLLDSMGIGMIVLAVRNVPEGGSIRVTGGAAEHPKNICPQRPE